MSYSTMNDQLDLPQEGRWTQSPIRLGTEVTINGTCFDGDDSFQNVSGIIRGIRYIVGYGNVYKVQVGQTLYKDISPDMVTESH